MEPEDKDDLCANDLSPFKDFIHCDVFGSESEAAESDATWGKCSKHPGHANFIPISEFGLEKLPEQYRNQSVVDAVKAVANLTVKLVVRHNTEEREHFADFCYSMGGDRNSVHVGSGWITDITEFYGSCGGCAECARSSSSTVHNDLPNDTKKYYRVYVASVKHVVYNHDEVQATEVQIFYEDKQSRKEKRMKSIYASSLNLGITRDDSIILECITHDESLVGELQVCLERMRSLLIKKYRTDRDYRNFNPEILPVDRKNNLCIMVSHPHGQPKMVTVGKRREIYYSLPLNVEYRRQATIQTAIHYDTESCPGSSGAPVFMPTCIELRQINDTRRVNSLVDAFVLRSHSIGNIDGRFNMSAGVMPLCPLPLLILALPCASEIKS